MKYFVLFLFKCCLKRTIFIHTLSNNT
jgi:hypothetical protein